MKCLVFFRVLSVCLLALSPLVMAAYESPLTDDYQTIALWNMDSTRTLSDGKVIVFDQDSNITRTNRHLTMYDGDTGNGYGATLVDSKTGFSKAMQFDGVNDYAKSFIRFPINAGFKIECWVKLDSTKTDINWIAEIPSVFRLYSDTNATRINLVVYDANGNPGTQLRKAITPDTWMHLTASFDDGTAYLSVDGTTQSGTVTLPTSATNKAGQEDYVWIGSFGGSQRFFKGQIDDFRLTDPAAEEPEAPAWAKVYEDTVRGTYGLYHVDEFVGSIIEDDKSVDLNRTKLNLTTYGNPQLVDDGSYPYSDSSFGSSISFDGMSDYLRCEVMLPYAIDPSNFRVEAWVKLNPDWHTISGGLYWIVGNDSMFRIYAESMNGTVSGARLRFYTWDSNGTAVLTNAACGELAGWNHIACEFYEGVAKTYINGVEKASATLSTTSAQVGTNKMIIGSYNGSSRMFWGQMDEIRISSAVMPEAECGDFGYLESDVNKDCIVDVEDLSIIVADWLKCTADEAGCESLF